MVLLEAAGGAYRAGATSSPRTGLVVVGVEFRNGGGKHGAHPFPAGLNDCSSALRWVHEHRGELGISTLVVSGESGGGNLTLATTLRAKREGDGRSIDGVYAQCPYISGAYADPPAELTSLHENDGYFIDCRSMAVRWPRSTTPTATTRRTRWRGRTTPARDELAGLPPHVISVNQLDPLRDEGLAYYRQAGRRRRPGRRAGP